MRIFFLILLLSFFLACTNVSKVPDILPPPENSKTQIIKLVDSLGSITISLPSRYDTNFSWTHHSDCGSSCDKIKYRFQPRSLPINRESGWMWYDAKDSVERFTVIHYFAYTPQENSFNSAYFLNFHLVRKAEMVTNPTTYKIKSDTIEKINGRYFSIFDIDLYDSMDNLYSKKLLAATVLKNRFVEINFEFLTKQEDSSKSNFLDNSRYFLRTVRINK
jgi:hypothetical protein